MKKILLLFCLIFALSTTLSNASVFTEPKTTKLDEKITSKTIEKVSIETKIFELNEFETLNIAFEKRQKNFQTLEFNKTFKEKIQDVNIVLPDIGLRNYLRKQTDTDKQLDKIHYPNPR